VKHDPSRLRLPTRPDATQLTAGLDVGYGDRYTKNLRDQLIDIAGLPPGTY